MVLRNLQLVKIMGHNLGLGLGLIDPYRKLGVIHVVFHCVYRSVKKGVPDLTKKVISWTRVEGCLVAVTKGSKTDVTSVIKYVYVDKRVELFSIKSMNLELGRIRSIVQVQRD